MGTVRVVAFVLIATSVLALAYGGFAYTKETHEMKIGPIDISVKDKETVNIPIWAGVGAIVTLGLFVSFAGKKRLCLVQGPSSDAGSAWIRSSC